MLACFTSCFESFHEANSKTHVLTVERPAIKQNRDSTPNSSAKSIETTREIKVDSIVPPSSELFSSKAKKERKGLPLSRLVVITALILLIALTCLISWITRFTSPSSMITAVNSWADLASKFQIITEPMKNFTSSIAKKRGKKYLGNDIFLVSDTNNDGLVDSMEFTAAADKLGFQADAANVMLNFRDLDDNHYLSKNEFLAAFGTLGKIKSTGAIHRILPLILEKAISFCGMFLIFVLTNGLIIFICSAIFLLIAVWWDFKNISRNPSSNAEAVEFFLVCTLILICMTASITLSLCSYFFG